MQQPELKPNEVYAGAIVLPDGTGHHVILLEGDKDDGNWQDAMDWAKEQGGDLPNRIEQSLLFAHSKEQFKEDWYWSNTTNARNTEWAWYQTFYSGIQSTSHKYYTSCRARAVRRVAI